MSGQLQDIFDPDQFIPHFGPVTPGTQAFLDSLELSAFETSEFIGAEDNYLQGTEEPAQAMTMNDILTDDQLFMEFFKGAKREEERAFAGTLNDAELFGTENDSTDIQTAPDFTTDDLMPDTETAMVRYTTIDDSQIDPALLGPSTGITSSSLFFYTPQEIQDTIGGTEVYESINLSPPVSDLNMPCQIPAFSQLQVTEEATNSTEACPMVLEQLIVPIGFGDFFQSAVTPPRIRIDGAYAVEHNRTGSVYQYTTYTPLPTWHAPGFASGISYNSLGFLDKEIQFTASTLINFIRHHPLGPGLILRIEKHPYEVKRRFASATKPAKGKPKYTCCRDANCVLGGTLKVGELRVAIDEITGRFKDSDEQDNDPYFACGFLHLQCFETLVNIAPLLHMGLLVPDLRKDFVKEPPCGKGLSNNNRMALSAKETGAFNEWFRSSSSSQDQVLGRESLTSKLWLANCKKSRIKCVRRAPPGVTQEDIDAQSKTSALWGGRRAVGRSVAEMNRLEEEGRCDELIAPRNGTSGKLGMGPTGATALRFSKRKCQDAKPGKASNKRTRLSTPPPPSPPDRNLRKTTLRSPPQKRVHKSPSNISVYSTPKRKILSPTCVFSPSLSKWSLLDSPVATKNFATLPLGPRCSQPPTPASTRTSPRIHKEVNYTGLDNDGEYRMEGNDKENGDWALDLGLFEEYL